MTTLSADEVRKFIPHGTDRNHLPVIAADIIYEGAAVGDNGSGYARPLVAGDPFRGFALKKADNAAGSAGDINVEVRRFGTVILPITSLAITDVGKDVFASDDNAFTLTQGSNTRIGYVSRWIESGLGEVTFRENDGDTVELTDSSTGTVSDTVADVGASFSQATLNNNFASLAGKVNELARRQGR